MKVTWLKELTCPSSRLKADRKARAMEILVSIKMAVQPSTMKSMTSIYLGIKEYG
jgi:hypothetical protein